MSTLIAALLAGALSSAPPSVETSVQAPGGGRWTASDEGFGLVAISPPQSESGGEDVEVRLRLFLECGPDEPMPGILVEGFPLFSFLPGEIAFDLPRHLRGVGTMPVRIQPHPEWREQAEDDRYLYRMVPDAALRPYLGHSARQANRVRVTAPTTFGPNSRFRVPLRGSSAAMDAAGCPS